MKSKEKKLLTKVKKLFIVWTICSSSFIFLIFIDNVLKETFLKIFLDNSIMAMLAIGIVLGGVVSFLLFLVNAISYFLKKGKIKKRTPVIKVLKTLLIILILPLLLLFETLKHPYLIKLIIKKRAKELFAKKFLKSYAFSFLVIIFLFPLWISPYLLIGYISANALGFVSSPIPIAGTGSMYPTFPKGDSKTPQELGKEIVGTPGMLRYPNGLILFGHRYFNYTLQRGDIISFKNSITEAITKKQYGEGAGYIKRLIALPGDIIELKNGLVYLNGESLKEPYTAKPHSTFAEAFLSECKQLKVPPNNIFAMGDNRKGSGDSREIGFVNLKDIDHVLPIASQKGVWDKNYRNTSNDLSESSKIKLDKDKYMELLNEKRKEAGVKPLIYQLKLEQSAFRRGEIILKFDDFSWEATRSGYAMQRAMADVGYSNITYGEAPTQGYFEAEELIDNQFQFPRSKEFLLNKDYQEVGISEIEGDINGCPTQVIIQHFAGYVPPNYTAETIDSWGRVINDLSNVIPGWEKTKDWPNMNKDDLNKLLGLMYKRKNNAEAIYYRMKANQWLTNDEKTMANEDKNLYDQIEALAKKLNGK